MDDETQRIARLTSLADVLARFGALVEPVAPRSLDVSRARGRTLAEDLVAGPYPAVALALRDGWAVDSAHTSDAGPYAPAPLPAAVLVDVGEELPPGADAVAPFDAVLGRDGRYEAIAPIVPGEGVLPAEAGIRAGATLRRAGERLRAADIAVLAFLGVATVTVREPRIRLVASRARGDASLDVACDLIARVAGAAGAAVDTEAGDLAAAFADERIDAVFSIGGTGSGREDASVHTLARLGRIEAHGIALSPGETAAFGIVGTKPALLLPGRLDSALAVWLTLGRALVARLSGRDDAEPTVLASLARKVASPLGMAEVVPVRLEAGDAVPIASGYWPLQALAQADGWIFVPPDSEGYPAGAEVVIGPWP